MVQKEGLDDTQRRKKEERLKQAAARPGNTRFWLSQEPFFLSEGLH